MECQVTGFHQEAEERWVAELECGHNKHDGQRTNGEAEKSRSDRIARTTVL
jgi:hypothetical protein